MLRLLTRPRWLVRHVLVIGLCVAFALLGRWQLHRGEATQGTIQNYGYAIEWPLFGVAVMFGWWKMLQDELHPDGKGKKAKAPKVSPWHIPEQATAVSAPGTTVTTAAVEPAPDVSTPDVSTPEMSTPVIATPAVSTPGVSTPGVSTPVVTRLGAMDDDRNAFPKPLTTADIDPDDLEVVRYNEWLAQFTKAPVNGYRAKAHR